VQYALTHPGSIRRIYALDRDDAGAAMLAHGTGGWCRQTLAYRLDLEHAGTALQDWVVQEMDRTPPAVAAAMHRCFEDVDTIDILPAINAPVLLLSGDKSQISSDQQKTFAEKLPNGRLNSFAGYGHGVNLLLPERCAQAALTFWNSLASAGNAQRRAGDIARLV
jgi:pimeloyl-ACP methyl ester carboxylesterase